MSKLDRLQDEDLFPQSSAVEQTPSGDQSLGQQGNKPRQAAAADPAMPLEDVKPVSTDAGATVDRDRGVDRQLLERLQVLEGFQQELQRDGLRDIRVGVDRGRFAELRAQRDTERAFEQARMEVVDEQLRIAGTKARGRQYQSLLLLGLLISVAALVAGSVYSGRLADNPVFWAIAGTVFFMSCAAIIIFAAAALGAFAEMMQLIRTQFRSVEQPSAQVTTTGSDSTLSIEELRDKYGKDE
ncbi:MAG TPA: hypothetical protein VOA19_09950 [Actinomycetes bacterium]|nr:hypothetical protein [Actinomycetes bacterium]